MTTETVHPVDEKLPTGRLAALGLQHVLVMYSGAIAVPLIVGRALKLSPEQVALLISADLFACGIVTLIQSLVHRFSKTFTFRSFGSRSSSTEIAPDERSFRRCL